MSLGHTSIYGRLKLGQERCTDDEHFSQSDLSCEIIILSDNFHVFDNNSRLLSYQQTDYAIVKNNTDKHTKASPFLIGLSILLGTSIVLFLALTLYWFINSCYRQKLNNHLRRQRHSTRSGVEEANHDWIYLDRNSLEMPIEQQGNSPSIHNSTLHITPNPFTNISVLQQQNCIAIIRTFTFTNDCLLR